MKDKFATKKGLFKIKKIKDLKKITPAPKLYTGMPVMPVKNSRSVTLRLRYGKTKFCSLQILGLFFFVMS